MKILFMKLFVNYHFPWIQNIYELLSLDISITSRNRPLSLIPFTILQSLRKICLPNELPVFKITKFDRISSRQEFFKGPLRLCDDGRFHENTNLFTHGCVLSIKTLTECFELYSCTWKLSPYSMMSCF